MIKDLEPILDDFKNSFDTSALSSSSMIATNQSTVALPKETGCIKPLLLSKTHKIATPSSIANLKDFDSTKIHLERPIATHQKEK
jgi:hypothetical protein